MFLIWSGWGILTIPIVLVAAVVVGGGLQAALTAAGRPDLAFLAFFAGGMAGAAANWVIGRRLNGTPPRELLDPRTHERVLLYRRHKLFWIPMQYWSIPVAIAALVPLLALFGT
jgi:membrane protein DedA with SNARE-associated domain